LTALESIVLRRGMLLARVKSERAVIGRGLDPFAGAIAIADRGASAVRWLRDNPLVASAGLAAIAVVQPRRALRWARLSLTAWQTLRWMNEVKARMQA
jgi:hypothetical protein